MSFRNVKIGTSHPNARGEVSIPSQGAKISRALWTKEPKHKQKQYCNKFNKDIKNGPHLKKKNLCKNVKLTSCCRRRDCD